MAAISMDEHRLDIGRVITTTFGVLGRNIGPFLGLSALLVGAPTAIVGWSVADLVADPDNLTFGAPQLATVTMGGLVAVITSAILQGALVYGAIRDLNGQRASFAEYLATGLRQFLPILLLSILMGLGLAVGFILLVVPGLILLVIWSVAVPAKVAEGLGVTEAFGRSADLTRHNRWRIFALMLIYLVLTWVIQAVLSPLAFMGMMGGAESMLITQTLTGAVSGVFNGLIGATGASVLYAELRRLKEGMNPDALAALFD